MGLKAILVINLRTEAFRLYIRTLCWVLPMGPTHRSSGIHPPSQLSRREQNKTQRYQTTKAVYDECAFYRLLAAL